MAYGEPHGNQDKDQARHGMNVDKRKSRRKWLYTYVHTWVSQLLSDWLSEWLSACSCKCSMMLVPSTGTVRTDEFMVPVPYILRTWGRSFPMKKQGWRSRKKFCWLGRNVTNICGKGMWDSEPYKVLRRGIGYLWLTRSATATNAPSSLIPLNIVYDRWFSQKRPIFLKLRGFVLFRWLLPWPFLTMGSWTFWSFG